MKDAFKDNFRATRFVLSLFGALIIVSALFIYQLSATAENEANRIQPVPELVDSTFGPQSRDIFFDYESDLIREDAVGVLADNADILKRNPDMFVIIQGEWDINETGGKLLGESRAQNVRNFIIDQGVEAGRILTSSNCDQHELTVSHTPEYQELSRKVHFISLEPQIQGFASIIEYVDNSLEG
jgi:outer membrane protein OmpA-like peptidoglycan-associated protein